ncbi:MAG: hypothetical protein LBK02_08865, partial [Treponema sp.]|nr:hypothetical protein [Treponema sp.]
MSSVPPPPDSAPRRSSVPIVPIEAEHLAPKAASGRSLIRHGSALSLLTLVSRVLGLVREMAKASLLGTSALSDA